MDIKQNYDYSCYSVMRVKIYQLLLYALPHTCYFCFTKFLLRFLFCVVWTSYQYVPSVFFAWKHFVYDIFNVNDTYFVIDILQIDRMCDYMNVSWVCCLKIYKYKYLCIMIFYITFYIIANSYNFEHLLFVQMIFLSYSSFVLR